MSITAVIVVIVVAIVAITAWEMSGPSRHRRTSRREREKTRSAAMNTKDRWDA